MKLTQEEVKDAVYDDSDSFEVVEELSWESDGKYDNGEAIVKHIPTGKFYRITGWRTGSYYSEYETEFDTTLEEVQKVQVTRWEWQ